MLSFGGWSSCPLTYRWCPRGRFLVVPVKQTTARAAAPQATPEEGLLWGFGFPVVSAMDTPDYESRARAMLGGTGQGFQRAVGGSTWSGSPWEPATLLLRAPGP